MRPVARARKDQAGGSVLQTGANSVIVNDMPIATRGVTTISSGAVVVSGSTTVIAEDQLVARQGDALSNGRAISSSSNDVFVD
jgi:uncharacterized Zn-binding protein involved in type VI secretion